MHQMTVLTGHERRRRWSEDDRRRVLAAAFSPGAVVSEVARRLDVATSLIYKWRQMYAAARPGEGFSPVVLLDERVRPSPSAAWSPAILVELANGARVSIEASARADLVTAALLALKP